METKPQHPRTAPQGSATGTSLTSKAQMPMASHLHNF